MEGTSARTPRERKAAQRYSPSPPAPRGRARQKVNRRLGESQELLDRLAGLGEPAVEVQEPLQEEEEQEDLDQDWLPEGAAAVLGSLAAAVAGAPLDAQEGSGTGRRNAASFFLEETGLLPETSLAREGQEEDSARAGLPGLSDSEEETSDEESDEDDSGDEDNSNRVEAREVAQDQRGQSPISGSVQEARKGRMGKQWRSNFMGESESEDEEEAPVLLPVAGGQGAVRVDKRAQEERANVQEEQVPAGADPGQQEAPREAEQEPTALEQEVQPKDLGFRGQQGQPEVVRPAVHQEATGRRWQGGKAPGGGVWQHMTREEGSPAMVSNAPRPTGAQRVATGGRWQGGRVGGGGVWQGGGAEDDVGGQGSRLGSDLQNGRQRQAAQWKANRASPPTCVTEQGSSQLPLILQQVDQHYAANFQQPPAPR